MRLEVTPDVAAAIKQRQIRVCLFFEFQFEFSVERLWTRLGTIDWGGATWYGAMGQSGVGSILTGVSKVSEANEIKAINATFSLVGVPNVDTGGRNILQLVNETVRQGGRVRAYFGFFNLTTNALLADPVKWYDGILDTPVLELAPDGTFSVTLNAETKMSRLQSHCPLRYDRESLQSRFPGDRGLDYTQQSVHDQTQFG